MTNPKLPAAEHYKALGLALAALRQRAGLTQVEVARKVGIRDTFVSQIENGHRGMRWHTLLALLDAYHADLRDLASAIEDAEHHAD